MKSLLSDISSASASPTGGRGESETGSGKGSQAPSGEACSVPVQARDCTESATLPKGNHGSGEADGLKALSVIGLVIIVILVINANLPSPPAAPVPSPTVQPPPAPKLPFFPLPDVVGPQASGLREMIDASQADDESRLAKAKLLLDKLPRPKPPTDNAIRKQARDLNTEGTKLLAAGDFLHSAQFYYDGSKLDPSDVELADNLGYALLQAGEFDEARKALLSALTISPVRANSWNSLGMVYAALSKPADAIAAYQNGWRYSRSRSKTLSTWLTIAQSYPNPLVERAADQAFTKVAEHRVALQLRTAVGKLRSSGVPVVLPNGLKSVADELVAPANLIFVVDNQTFPIAVAEDGYSLYLASTPDCDAMYCLLGNLSARKGDAEQLSPEQESIPLNGQINAIWKGEAGKGILWISFHRDGVNYSTELGARREVVIDLAKSMADAVPIPPSPRQLVAGVPPQLSAAPFAERPGAGSPGNAPTAPPLAAVMPTQPTRLPEELPPVGADNILNNNQIRYCLAEKIRIKAHEAQVNANSQSSVNALNRYVDDYNLRCAAYRYRRGTLESVRSEVEPYRQGLERDGIARAAANP